MGIYVCFRLYKDAKILPLSSASPLFKISQHLPACEQLIFSDASAETVPGPRHIVLLNGFGITWGNFAVVETLESLLSILHKLRHFDDESVFEWSSTKAEQTAAIFGLIILLHHDLLQPNLKYFSVLECIDMVEILKLKIITTGTVSWG